MAELLIVASMEVRAEQARAFEAFERRAFEAYRVDPRLADLQPLREQSVIATRIVEGQEGPDYAAREGRGPGDG